MADLEHRPSTPDDALQELLAGNERFVAGARIHPHQDAERRAAVANAQRPFAVVFGCSDSRLAAEIIFDRGLGDLFVVRTAGHIIGAEVLASIEYGITVLGARLLVVLGHDSCGAIQATHDAMTGNAMPGPGLRAIVDRVVPSIRHAHQAGVTDLDSISTTHVQLTVAHLSADHPRLAEAVAGKECAVVGLTYRLEDGRVTVVAAETGARPESWPVTTMESPRIRPMLAEDAAAVLEIYQAGLDSGQASFETAAPDWAAFDTGRLPGHRFVAVDVGAVGGAEVVGWVAVSPVSARPVYAGVVEHSVYVRPAARGRGVGRLLLDALITSTEAAGIWTIQSGIFPENESSLALHRAAGFRVIGTRERVGRHHGVWRDVVLMERRSPVVA